ncbi:hypothetical protein KAR34_08420 [bacterium]|nr:hypothetical protein [bacterium]
MVESVKSVIPSAKSAIKAARAVDKIFNPDNGKYQGPPDNLENLNPGDTYKTPNGLEVEIKEKYKTPDGEERIKGRVLPKAEKQQSQNAVGTQCIAPNNTGPELKTVGATLAVAPQSDKTPVKQARNVEKILNPDNGKYQGPPDNLENLNPGDTYRAPNDLEVEIKEKYKTPNGEERIKGRVLPRKERVEDSGKGESGGKKATGIDIKQSRESERRASGPRLIGGAIQESTGIIADVPNPNRGYAAALPAGVKALAQSGPVDIMSRAAEKTVAAMEKVTPKTIKKIKALYSEVKAIISDIKAGIAGIKESMSKLIVFMKQVEKTIDISIPVSIKQLLNGLVKSYKQMYRIGTKNPGVLKQFMQSTPQGALLSGILESAGKDCHEAMDKLLPEVVLGIAEVLLQETGKLKRDAEQGSLNDKQAAQMLNKLEILKNEVYAQKEAIDWDEAKTQIMMKELGDTGKALMVMISGSRKLKASAEKDQSSLLTQIMSEVNPVDFLALSYTVLEESNLSAKDKTIAGAIILIGIAAEGLALISPFVKIGEGFQPVAKKTTGFVCDILGKKGEKKTRYQETAGMVSFIGIAALGGPGGLLSYGIKVGVLGTVSLGVIKGAPGLNKKLGGNKKTLGPVQDLLFLLSAGAISLTSKVGLAPIKNALKNVHVKEAESGKVRISRQIGQLEKIKINNKAVIDRLQHQLKTVKHERQSAQGLLKRKLKAKEINIKHELNQARIKQNKVQIKEQQVKLERNQIEQKTSTKKGRLVKLQQEAKSIKHNLKRLEKSGIYLANKKAGQIKQEAKAHGVVLKKAAYLGQYDKRAAAKALREEILGASKEVRETRAGEQSKIQQTRAGEQSKIQQSTDEVRQATSEVRAARRVEIGWGILGDALSGIKETMQNTRTFVKDMSVPKPKSAKYSFGEIIKEIMIPRTNAGVLLRYGIIGSLALEMAMPDNSEGAAVFPESPGANQNLNSIPLKNPIAGGLKTITAMPGVSAMQTTARAIAPKVKEAGKALAQTTQAAYQKTKASAIETGKWLKQSAVVSINQVKAKILNTACKIDQGARETYQKTKSGLIKAGEWAKESAAASINQAKANIPDKAYKLDQTSRDAYHKGQETAGKIVEWGKKQAANLKYQGVKHTFKQVFTLAGNPVLNPMANMESYGKKYPAVAKKLKTDWKNISKDYDSQEKAGRTVEAKAGTLKIDLHGRADMKLESVPLAGGQGYYKMSEELYNASPDKHKFIMSYDGRPMGIVPAKNKALSPEIQQALSEGRIMIINQPKDMGEIISQNHIIPVANGIGNENRIDPPDYAKGLAKEIIYKGMKNTFAVPLYNRSEKLDQKAKNGASDTAMFIQQNLLRDSLMINGSEMLLPISVQRDKILRELEWHVNEIKYENKLGPCPSVLFIGFSGGFQPSQETATYFKDKASLINLDGPASENDISGIYSYTRMRSSWIGDMYSIGKTPERTREINITPPDDPRANMDTNNHHVFFEKEAVKAQVLEEVERRIEERYNIMYDDLRYIKK